MPKYRLVAIDIDGTLLTDDKKMTDLTEMWINRHANLGFWKVRIL